MSASAATDRDFPPTAWTVLLAARDPAAPETAAAREELCRAYWRPVAAYLGALGLPEPDAQDGAQEIMAHLFSRDGVEHIQQGQGRLRAYLKSAARHYLCKHRRHDSAQKRGGGGTVLTLEEISDSAAAQHPAPDDHCFDREWALTLCDRALAALETSYSRRGKGALFLALRPALILPDDQQRHAGTAAQFAVSEPQIRLELHRLRRRLASTLRSEVAATLGALATAAEVEEEARYLVATLAQGS